MLPREMIMRVNKMITKEKMLWPVVKLSHLFFKGNVWRSVWRIYMWISGLKGLKNNVIWICESGLKDHSTKKRMGETHPYWEKLSQSNQQRHKTLVNIVSTKVNHQK